MFSGKYLIIGGANQGQIHRNPRTSSRSCYLSPFPFSLLWQQKFCVHLRVPPQYFSPERTSVKFCPVDSFMIEKNRQLLSVKLNVQYVQPSPGVFLHVSKQLLSDWAVKVLFKVWTAVLDLGIKHVGQMTKNVFYSSVAKVILIILL